MELGRGHTFQQLNDSLAELLKSKIAPSQVTTDLMIGIPNQTIDSLEDSLDKVIDLGFYHISLYMLQLEQGTPFYKKYH